MSSSATATTKKNRSSLKQPTSTKRGGARSRSTRPTHPTTEADLLKRHNIKKSIVKLPRLDPQISVMSANNQKIILDNQNQVIFTPLVELNSSRSSNKTPSSSQDSTATPTSTPNTRRSMTLRQRRSNESQRSNATTNNYNNNNNNSSFSSSVTVPLQSEETPTKNQSKFVLNELVFAKHLKDNNFYPATVKGVINKTPDAEDYNGERFYLCDMNILNKSTMQCELAESCLLKASDLKSGDIVFVKSAPHSKDNPELLKGCIVDGVAGKNLSSKNNIIYNVETIMPDGTQCVGWHSYKEIILPPRGHNPNKSTSLPTLNQKVKLTNGRSSHSPIIVDSKTSLYLFLFYSFYYKF